MQKIISEIEKNNGEAIRIELTEFEDFDLIGIRVYALREGQDAVPTRKGSP